MKILEGDRAARCYATRILPRIGQIPVTPRNSEELEKIKAHGK